MANSKPNIAHEVVHISICMSMSHLGEQEDLNGIKELFNLQALASSQFC